MRVMIAGPAPGSIEAVLIDIILVLILLALLGLGGWFVLRAASGGGRKH